jgi:hypothetical protein
MRGFDFERRALLAWELRVLFEDEPFFFPIARRSNELVDEDV